ncbi:hypothetical protein D0T84_05975 [Dysgonomonas sp. 521]|uniref:hypothetical protein n=1 Tax=Dysgonomonas sp. 521 TaxID=2302932 RepID=UPI0013CF7A20|nr:hypothetical protein [Dysgonomonas sp. 521]NDV94469.1 hypothetical protein [Dysgonomonas sp. 521]
MKKIILTLLTTTFLFSCGGSTPSSNSDSESSTGTEENASSGKELISKNFDYKIFSDEAEVKKVVEGVIAKAGDNMSKLDKIDIWISRPSKEGSIRRDKPDYATITLTYLNPDDAKKLFEYRYDSDNGGWDKGQAKTVRLVTGNKETFVLANEMYDASALTSDMVAQAVKEAWAKYKNEAKYSDQWVRGIIIKNGQIEVGVRGILSANDLEKTEYYKKKIAKK